MDMEKKKKKKSEREKRLRQCEVFGQSNCEEDGVAIYRNKGLEKSRFGENQDFYFSQV